MPKKKEKKASSEIQLNFSNLVDSKFVLLKDLDSVRTEFNQLADSDMVSIESWIYGLPIEKASDLEKPKMSRLSKVKARKKLYQSSMQILSKIESVEDKIKLAYIDVLAEKIDKALSENDY